MPKRCEKRLYDHIRVVVCKKTAQTDSQYSKNGRTFKIGKNGHNAKAIAHAKWSVWVNNYNCLKDAKNVSTNTLKLFYARNGSTKQLIFEKREHFENGQKWPQSKGYRPCKMVSLRQKLKMPKRCEKLLDDHITVVVCKKALQKTAYIRKIRAF